MKTFLASLTALLLLLALPGSSHAAPVTIKGSDTMVILAQRWAETFMKKNPTVKLQVTGGGSGVGLSALINGTTDIAMASRPIKDAENKQLSEKTQTPATEIAMARDGVTFYVNEANKVDALTEEQLKGIYTGDLTHWKDVGGADAPIIVYSRENSSGTYSFVKDDLLKGEDYTSSAQTLPGTAAVVNAVTQEKNGIGYGGAAYAKGIKELKIKKGGELLAPTADNIRSGKYPLSRNLFFYLRARPTGDAKAFIDYALSPEGQKLVTEVGYFPLK
jgi:phosphate transport system substrate-binding protein